MVTAVCGLSEGNDLDEVKGTEQSDVQHSFDRSFSSHERFVGSNQAWYGQLCRECAMGNLFGQETLSTTVNAFAELDFNWIHFL